MAAKRHPTSQKTLLTPSLRLPEIFPFFCFFSLCFSSMVFHTPYNAIPIILPVYKVYVFPKRLSLLPQTLPSSRTRL